MSVFGLPDLPKVQPTGMEYCWGSGFASLFSVHRGSYPFKCLKKYVHQV